MIYLLASSLQTLYYQFFVNGSRVDYEKIEDLANASAYANCVGYFDGRHLFVNASSEHSQHNQLYLVAYAEGILLREEIEQYVDTVKANINMTDQIIEIADRQLRYIEENGEQPEYKRLLEWLMGMRDATQLDLSDIYLINFAPDLAYYSAAHRWRYVPQSNLLITEKLHVLFSPAGHYGTSVEAIVKTVLLCPHSKYYMQRVTYTSFPGQAGGNFYIIHADVGGDEIGKRACIVEYFPYNGSEQSGDYVASGFAIHLQMFNISASELRTGAQYQITYIDYTRGLVTQYEYINNTKRSVLNITAPTKLLIRAVPMELRDFGLPDDDEYYMRNNQFVDHTLSQPIGNTSDLLDLAISCSSKDNITCFGSRYDLNNTIGLPYGQQQIIILTPELENLFQLYFDTGINGREEYNGLLPSGQEVTYIKTVYDVNNIITSCDSRMADCNRCTNGSYNVTSNCTKCIDTYVSLYNDTTDEFYCVEYNFQPSIILLSCYYVGIVTLFMAWFIYFFTPACKRHNVK